MNGDGPDKQMIDTAGTVADFAYKQGVGEALAVDQLIQKYRALREERDRALDDIEMLRAVNARLVKDIDQARIDAACVGEMADRAEAETERLQEENRILRLRVEELGEAWQRERNHETSDAVRERPIRHLPVNGPDDRQPNAPSTEAGRRAAPAGGHSSEQDREKR
jgi:hypothetical protein